MKSLFRFPGGKARKNVKEKILSHQPNYYSSYREPFVGGGGIFFEIPIEKNRWINDINKDLMSVYTALQSNPEKFINECRLIEPHKEEEIELPPIYNKRLKNKFFELIEKRNENPALTYFFVNRTVWAGRVNYNIKSRLYFSNPTGWNITKSDLLEKIAELLKNVKITFLNYKDIISEDGEDVWIYCDPPYYSQTIDSASDKLYQHCFLEKDHYELRDLIKNSKHKILISYDDCEFIRNLYKNFNVINEEWTYCGTSCNVKKIGKELLIKNY